MDMRARIRAEEAEIARQRASRRPDMSGWSWRLADLAGWAVGGAIVIFILALFIFSAWAPPIE